MAVQLPSDIVADVMRSADPVRRLAATRKLEQAGTPEMAQFATLIDVGDRGSGAISPSQASSDVCSFSGGGHCRSSEVYRDFEQVVLRSLFEVMLPTEESGAFGAGPSAGVWRSMAAQELSGVWADGGGIGIGKLLASSSEEAGPRREAQWPYFSLNALDTFRG